MDTDIYICSKPLQYFNVRNIGYGNASSKKVLIILGHFRDAELFFHQVKTFDDTWNDILYFKDLFHLDLYLFFHPVNTLFVEVDASFVYGIFLSYPDLNECICLKKDSEATEEIVLIIQKA